MFSLCIATPGSFERFFRGHGLHFKESRLTSYYSKQSVNYFCHPDCLCSGKTIFVVTVSPAGPFMLDTFGPAGPFMRPDQIFCYRT